METLTNPKNGNGLISVNDLVMNLDKKKELAQIFIRSGLIPAQLNTPEKVLVCLFKSQELGLPPLEGLSGMAVISGKTTLQGNLLLALINRSNKAKKIVIEENESYCTVTMSRRDYEFEYSFTFSLDDAKKAGLLDKQIWKQYPKTMLKWRAVSGCARVVFSDVIGGLYTPEEIISISDNEVNAKVDDEGNVEVIETSASYSSTIDETFETVSNELNSAQVETKNEAVEKLKEGIFWNGKVYKGNSVYLDDQRFKLSDVQLSEFLNVWKELQNNKDVYSGKDKDEDLPF